MLKGNYDLLLAVKLWEYYVNNCVRHPEFKKTYGDWKPSVAVRRQVAEYFSVLGYEEVIEKDSELGMNRKYSSYHTNDFLVTWDESNYSVHVEDANDYMAQSFYFQ